MNQKELQKEAEQWRKEGIINEEQLQTILLRYDSKKSHPYLLLTFAGLFIGLGFLTFIASNWEGIAELGKMLIIIAAMLAFYLTGHYIYHRFSPRLGLSFILIGLLIFGAGIFLTGQMFHYIFFSAVPFLIWSLAGFVLFMIYSHASLFFAAILINTVGQLYSGIVYQDINYGLLLLLLFGFGHYTYHQGKRLYGFFFAGSFAIQALVFCLTEQQPYYWMSVYLLALYLLGILLRKQTLKHSFQSIGLFASFIMVVFQVFFLSDAFWREQLTASIVFFLVWGILFAGAAALRLMNHEKIDAAELVLFVPVFWLPLADMIAMLLLFVFSVGYLLAGYAEQTQEKIIAGTFAFLFSTLIAYIHLAWDFLDKSLFFFIGGILLFLLSLFLEKKRRRAAGGVEGRR